MGTDHLLKSSPRLKAMLLHVNKASAPEGNSEADNSGILQSINDNLLSISALLQTLIAIQHKLLQHEITEPTQEDLAGWTVVPRRDAADKILDLQLRRSKD